MISKRLSITIIVTSVFIILLFITADLLRFRKALILNPTKNITKVQTTKETPSKPEIAREIVCKPKTIYVEKVYTPAPTDNIQNIIGYQNNKVGLYIYAEVHDFARKASEMINSNNGDWGYVLIPYNIKDYNETRWKTLFELLSEKHLIPIIQLWDLDLNSEKERNKQIRESAEFLNSLRWPIKKRYISVYNEPNDKNFWKGKINPAEYAEVLERTINIFNALNEDYFIMNGAFNASARSGNKFMDEETYLIKMNNQVPGIFKRLDGWASHSYPQPNFSGNPKSHGRDSIRAYEWELDILKNRFGVDTSKLPVFITETGWAHKESESPDNNNSSKYILNQYQVADNIRYAFENVWLPDPRIVAITPFTIRYDPPFDNFSWITQEGNPYPQFNAIKDIKKVKGKPPVVTYHKTRTLDCVYRD